MNNLEQIKKAWAMGWSAILVKIPSGKIYTIIGVGKNSFSAKRTPLGVTNFPKEEAKNFEITGYKYAGELAGNEPIPEGTKFKLCTGKIVKAIALLEPSHELDTEDKNGYKFLYPRRELTPYFND